MPLDPRDAATLWDIRNACRNAIEFVGDMSQDDFRADKKTHYAVIAQIEIIGEATKRLSMDFREAHAAIPWRKIAGMRDFLIHLYDEVDLEEVWNTTTESIPELLAYIELQLSSGEDAARSDSDLS